MASGLACEAGLHRCPDRYKTMFVSPNDRTLRKRVFYSLYTLDRILSAEFGIPIMLSDTDIDTCLPGDFEKHTEGEINAVHPARTPTDEMAQNTGGSSSGIGKRKRLEEDEPLSRTTQHANGSQISRTGVQTPSPVNPISHPPAFDEDGSARKRLLAATSLTQMARMIGRAMEMFNKSLKHRSLDCESARTLFRLG